MVRSSGSAAGPPSTDSAPAAASCSPTTKHSAHARGDITRSAALRLGSDGQPVLGVAMDVLIEAAGQPAQGDVVARRKALDEDH